VSPSPVVPIVNFSDDENDIPPQLPDRPRLQQPRKGRRLARKADEPPIPLTPEQRLLLLDTWQRSGLPAGDFAPLVGISKHTLYAWKKKFDLEGPAGLMDKPRGAPEGSRLPELTKRTILMLKEAHPDYGVERISALLLRGPGLAASPSAVAKVLHEAGYQLEEAPTKPHPDKVRSFERARPNQLWQTDLFTFVLEMLWRRSHLRLGPRGRPTQRSSRTVRQRLLAFIELLGPHVGVPILQTVIPEMSRRELQDFVRRYRRVWRRRHRRLLHVLHWQSPGSVWGIDFAEPPLPIDGCYAYLLAVRDLASGVQLLWLPVEDELAQTVCAALQSLFHSYGPPLVMKSDNGSGFIADGTKRVLKEWEVAHLRSPPECPEYNGSAEAGVGSMKTRTHHQAARRGCAGLWSSDDAEAARLQANETARPWGLDGPTPQECFDGRTPIASKDRDTFQTRMRQEERQARGEQGYPVEGQLDDSAQASVDRIALSRTLVELGWLSFTRQSKAPPQPQRAGRKPQAEDR
jgi:transposase InsO family protein